MKSNLDRVIHFRAFLGRCFEQILAMLDEAIEEMKDEKNTTSVLQGNEKTS